MSKVINPLIQEQVTEARQNIGITTVIAVAVSQYLHFDVLRGPVYELEKIRQIFVENQDICLCDENQLISLLDLSLAHLQKTVLDMVYITDVR